MARSRSAAIATAIGQAGLWRCERPWSLEQSPWASLKGIGGDADQCFGRIGVRIAGSPKLLEFHRSCNGPAAAYEPTFAMVQDDYSIALSAWALPNIALPAAPSRATTMYGYRPARPVRSNRLSALGDQLPRLLLVDPLTCRQRRTSGPAYESDTSLRIVLSRNMHSNDRFRASLLTMLIDRSWPILFARTSPASQAVLVGVDQLKAA